MNVFLFLNAEPSSGLWYKKHFESLRREGDTVLCADGGYRVARQAGIRPDSIIGDLDSMETDTALHGVDIQRFPVDKDYSDFELALQAAERHAPDRIYVYGALGGRIDHELTNILLIAHSRFPVISVEQGSEVYTVKRQLILKDRRGLICSLLAVGGPCRIRDMQGFRYCLHNEELRPSSRGLSNIVTSNKATISLSGVGLIVVLITSDRKQL
jgi:thiamine pyrophosphokinase